MTCEMKLQNRLCVGGSFHFSPGGGVGSVIKRDARRLAILLLTLRRVAGRRRPSRMDGARFACLKHRWISHDSARSRMMARSAREAGNFPRDTGKSRARASAGVDLRPIPLSMDR